MNQRTNKFYSSALFGKRYKVLFHIGFVGRAPFSNEFEKGGFRLTHLLQESETDIQNCFSYRPLARAVGFDLDQRSKPIRSLY